MQKIDKDNTRYPYGVLTVGEHKYLAYLPSMEVVYAKPLLRPVIEYAAARLNRHYHDRASGGKAAYARILVSLFNSATEAYAADRITQAECMVTRDILEG